MEQGLVVDEFARPVTAGRSYESHLRVYYYRDCATETRIPFDEVVLYQDAHLVVVGQAALPAGRALRPIPAGPCWSGSAQTRPGHPGADPPDRP